jgi:hypothetical protein
VQNDAAVTKVQEYVQSRPAVFSGLWLAYPEPPPASPPPTTNPNSIGTQVVVVGTVGDVDAARTALRQLWSGNLCVVSARHSRAERDAAQGRIPFRLWQQYRVYELIQDEVAGTLGVGLVVLDEPAYQFLTGIDHGAGILQALPWLQPVGR